jgi:hypothetical protein
MKYLFLVLVKLVHTLIVLLRCFVAIIWNCSFYVDYTATTILLYNDQYEAGGYYYKNIVDLWTNTTSHSAKVKERFQETDRIGYR